MIENTYILPKYTQISAEIIERIKSGALKPGSQIPSENEIIKTYQVSNTTARKVLQEIEKGGWVTKVKGKGTFVRDIVVDRSADKILSFTKNMLQRGLTPSTQVLETLTLNKDITKTISDKKYTLNAPIFKITRLRFADEVPVMKEIRYISLRYCKGIEKLNMEDSLYDIYHKEFNLQITRIEQVLSSIFLDNQTRKMFDIKKPTTGFLVDGVTFCGTDMILEMEESIYRGDKYKFNIFATP